MRVGESLRPEENESGRNGTRDDDNTLELEDKREQEWARVQTLRADESLRPDENKSGQEFKLFESA